jgi:hypothetical protein
MKTKTSRIRNLIQGGKILLKKIEWVQSIAQKTKNVHKIYVKIIKNYIRIRYNVLVKHMA